ncbi:hypothetical protein [Halalkalibacter krulwichiae]|uniref:Uncharacterized protein n=1 Tax=Halalkalibacter krulwichiae TaxID=199441 RepID=A0A1Y9THH3_9BACI|nr:hypothetical protein [Halalkalibacter krulwichiae]ARK28647.1 hypothetical protein BkAM31D_01585 [Halalkalibacter krulwichiae]
MQRSKIGLFLISLITLLILAACGSQSSSQEGSNAEDAANGAVNEGTN